VDDDVQKEMVALLPRLRRFALAMTRSEADADDLVQATCERAIANLEKWEPGTRLDSWMYRIAQNLQRNVIRQSKRRESHLSVVEATAASHSDGETAVMSQMALKDVAAHIDRLPEEQRMILLLVVAEGRRYRDVAEILDLPIGTVTSRLARARDTLRQCLEGTEP
jgi:RNA polymerase sigma-70 factor (ECF subfamily)